MVVIYLAVIYMPAYKALTTMNYDDRSENGPCCTSCAMTGLVKDPIVRAFALTAVNGWLMANADSSSSKREKMFYYTCTGMVNLVLFGGN